MKLWMDSISKTVRMDCSGSKWTEQQPWFILSDQITDVIVLSLQQYFSTVKKCKKRLILEEMPREFNSEKSQFDFFIAAFLDQLIAAPKAIRRHKAL